MDGWSEYKYNQVFSEAWKLTLSCPATKEWSWILQSLLAQAVQPIGFKEIDKAIDRWHIEDKNDEYKHLSGPIALSISLYLS